MKIAIAALAVALSAPMWAQAQTRYDTEEPAYGSRLGSSFDLMVDVNTLHYDHDVSADMDYGIGYGLILGINPIRNVGVEVNYAGGVNQMSSGFGAAGHVITNQIGGDLRLNVIPATYDLPLGFRPFAFAGVAYHRVDTSDFTPGISTANGVAIPAGVGADFHVAGFLVGGRFTYNWIYNETDNFSGRQPEYWSLGLNVGTHFQ